jgi:type VI secretion system protein ImpJ
MTRTHRILWGEGMFLRPQHFQQQELFLEARAARDRALNQAHPWGVGAVRLDTAALAQGLLACEQLQLVFQDGTAYDAPQEEPLPPARCLGDLPGLDGEPLVWACLPLLDGFGDNAAEPGQERGRPVRYHLERILLPDLHTGAPEAEVTVLRANVRLAIGQEPRDGQWAVPVARLRRDGAGAWAADPAFVPPVLALQAAPPLLALLKALAGMLQAKARALAGARRERGRAVLDYGAAEVASFWLLHTVHRTLPVLGHLLEFPRAHPEELYRLLAQLSGELCTFSTARGPEDIPPYRHLELTATFQALGVLVRELLDTVIPSRCAVVPLREVRPSIHGARLDLDRPAEGCDLYLSVNSEGPAAEVLEAVPLKLKVGSPDDVERILNSALPGVPLVHVPRTPPAVPVRLGNHYFALEPGGSIYERMIQARSVCVYAPQALPRMELELIAVTR